MIFYDLHLDQVGNWILSIVVIVFMCLCIFSSQRREK
jgi:hypothetical protein